jgi:hypothetical protein
MQPFGSAVLDIYQAERAEAANAKTAARGGRLMAGSDVAAALHHRRPRRTSGP